MNTFLTSAALPWLPGAVAQTLDLSISVGEVKAAMVSFADYKAPGPDGLPGEVYKLFFEQLAGTLLSVFLEALELGYLHPTLTEADLNFILKKGNHLTL